MEAQQGFSEGIRLLKKDRPDIALRIWEAETENNPDPNPWTRFFMARAAAALNDTSRAIGYYRDAAASSDPFIAFSAVREAASVIRHDVGPYAAASNLLEFAESDRFGAEALYRTGRILMLADDTTTACKMWRDLVMQYNSSPFAHKALLSILDLDSQLVERLITEDNYLALAMANAAFGAEDYSSAKMILESVERRPVDRRIREALLILQADVLYRLSYYDKAVEYYHEAARRSGTAQELQNARLGAILSELQMGDTIEPLISLYRVPSSSFGADYREQLMNVAAVQRARGETATAQAIWGVLDEPSLEEFLTAYDQLRTLIRGEGTPESISSTYWNVLSVAESLWDTTDRALAISLLAELGDAVPVSTPDDLWRIVIFDTESDFLLQHASRQIEKNSPGDREFEARNLLTAAMDELKSGDPRIGMKRLRLVAYGYPNSGPARTAREEIRLALRGNACLGPSACGTATKKMIWAWEMISGDGGSEAADWLRESPEPRMISLAAKGYHQSGRHREAIQELSRFKKVLDWPAPWLDFPEPILEQAFPMPHAAAFRAAADSFGVDRSLLLAIAREETQFDPTYHSAFRLGITALPVEAPIFAEEFENAPRLTTLEMLVPDSAIQLEAWYLGMLAKEMKTTSPERIAAARHAGPANATFGQADQSPLEILARVPFRESRKFLLNALFAAQVYGRRVAEKYGN